MTTKWFTAVVAVVVMVTFLVGGCAPKAATPPAQEKVITIGILGALTGPLRAIGEGAIGVYDYFTDLNVTDGGIKYKDPKTGREEVVRVELIMGDHAWDAAKSLSLYEKFKSQGMQLAFCNGSSPTASIYAAAARDKIPGLHVDCTSDPFIYELEKPYLAMNCPSLPAAIPLFVAWHVNEWKKEGNTRKLRLGLLAADVPSRRVLDSPEFGVLDYYKNVLGDSLEYLGSVYIPAAPIDVKAELTSFINKEADLIMVEHWGSGACRVVIKDAMALEMHKKGINMDIDWMPPDVPLAEPQLFDEYNKYARVMAYSHGWSGTESPEIINKYPGLKLAYDICAKYHNGQTPEERLGWFYMYGIKEAIIGHNAIKKTLEQTGWDSFTTEKLRDSIFGLSPIDTGGIHPTYYPDQKIFTTGAQWKIVSIRNGHFITEESTPWLFAGKTIVYPDFEIKVTDEYKDKVWFAPPFK